MNTEVDFNALWKREETTDVPDTKELFKKVGSLKKAARIRLILQSLVLLGTVAILLIVGFTIHGRQVTTTIGLVLMLMAIVSYLIATNQLLPMLFKSDIDGSSREYINQLIRIKRKYEFLDKVMVNIYFGLLSSGTFLFMLQFALKLSTAKAALFYGLIFAGLASTWIYSKTREIKRTLKPLNDTIKRLEALNDQMRDGD